MNSQRDVASFVLRFKQHCWQESNGEPRVEWRGHIRHVQGGEERCFTDMAEAMSLIHDVLLQLAMNAAPDADPDMQEKTIRESLKLWKQFSQTYRQIWPQSSPLAHSSITPPHSHPPNPVEPEITQLPASNVHGEAAAPQSDLPAPIGPGTDAQLALVLEKLDALQAYLEDISRRMAK